MCIRDRDRAGTGEFIAQIQNAIDQRPGVHQLANRLDTPYRVWLAELAKKAS